MSANPARAVRALPERRVVAIFDLDGTLTKRDTLFPYLRFLSGDLRFALTLPLVLPLLAVMAMGLVSRQRVKEWVLGIFLRGTMRDALAACGEEFARTRMPGLLRPQALRRLELHQERGHRCVLLSASPAPYVEAWARQAGFDDVIATQLEYDPQGRATGRIAGANCAGEEKVRRLRAHLGDLSRLTLHGYGDSHGDKPFLALCAEAEFRPFRDAPAAGEGHDKPRRNRLGDFWKLMRPHQWLKNGFVFVGVLFGHAWTLPDMVLGALLAAAAFCLVASAIYIVNDYADRERDRVHPNKRQRPLASGAVSPRAALGVAAALAAAGAVIGAAAGPVVLAIVAFYAAMNLAYSFALKSVVLLDVFVIAAGFILRILAGTLGIGIAPSQWLIVCSLFLTLFLGFTKRRSELLVVSSEYMIHRKALLHYNPALLDKLMGICAAAALMSYSLYTMSEQTALVHGTENLVYTIPFVAYGMFRYLYLLHAKQVGGDTSHELMRDRHLFATVACWALATVLLIA